MCQWVETFYLLIVSVVCIGMITGVSGSVAIYMFKHEFALVNPTIFAITVLVCAFSVILQLLAVYAQVSRNPFANRLLAGIFIVFDVFVLFLVFTLFFAPDLFVRSLSEVWSSPRYQDLKETLEKSFKCSGWDPAIGRIFTVNNACKTVITRWFNTWSVAFGLVLCLIFVIVLLASLFAIRQGSGSAGAGTTYLQGKSYDYYG